MGNSVVTAEDSSKTSSFVESESRPHLVSLVGEKHQHSCSKWIDSIMAPNGCVYGVPCDARSVIKFDPNNNQSTVIGNDLNDRWAKWYGGVVANNGCIYSIPFNVNDILKIDTNKDLVERLRTELPESEVGKYRWGRGALADDGCLYFFPFDASRILKIDPTNDTVSSVGTAMKTWSGKFCGTVKANNGYLYSIPFNSKRIFKYNPETEETSLVGRKANRNFKCRGNGALGSDGNIYAINHLGKVLMIDVANNDYDCVGDAPRSPRIGRWCGAIAGEDGNDIYFIPSCSTCVLQYNIPTKLILFLVGDDLGESPGKYGSGALSPSNGKIYCLPLSADRVLSIDTRKIGEMSISLKKSMSMSMSMNLSMSKSLSMNLSLEKSMSMSTASQGSDQGEDCLEEVIPFRR